MASISSEPGQRVSLLRAETPCLPQLSGNGGGTLGSSNLGISSLMPARLTSTWMLCKEEQAEIWDSVQTFMLSPPITEQPLRPRGEGVHLAHKNKQCSLLHSWT